MDANYSVSLLQCHCRNLRISLQAGIVNENINRAKGFYCFYPRVDRPIPAILG